MAETLLEPILLATVVLLFQQTVVQLLRDGMTQAAPAGGDPQDAGVYCPLGHVWIIAGEGEADRLRRENERLTRVAEARAESVRIAVEQRDSARRRTAAAKGQLTKVKNRVANGVCPACRRHFANVQKHMDGQHPHYAQPTHAGQE